MMIPTVHGDGTPRVDLMTAIVDAHLAVSEAIEKVAKTSPNARDYTPQGEDAYPKALDQHRERIAKLREVQADMELIGAAILVPDDERMRWRVENFHSRGVLSGYRVVRGPRTARQFDHSYVSSGANGSLKRALAMAETRRGLLNLGRADPQERTVTVE